jgi:hypothetical protein
MSTAAPEATGGQPASAQQGPSRPAAPTAPETREYLILESTQDGVWREKEKVTAETNEAALAAIKDPKREARYQAVAMRNWSPKSPKIETITSISYV